MKAILLARRPWARTNFATGPFWGMVPLIRCPLRKTVDGILEDFQAIRLG